MPPPPKKKKQPGNSCLGPKQYDTIFNRVKIGKQQCSKIAVIFTDHYSKCQFVVLHVELFGNLVVLWPLTSFLKWTKGKKNVKLELQ